MQNDHHVDVGESCFSKTKLKAMSLSLSDSMHDRLKEELKTTDSPISIIVDGSTVSKLTKIKWYQSASKVRPILLQDYGRNHYLSIILQILEKGHRVATHFYGLVQLGKSSTAISQRDALLKKFSDDGILQKIKEKTIALVIDGNNSHFKSFFECF